MRRRDADAATLAGRADPLGSKTPEAKAPRPRAAGDARPQDVAPGAGASLPRLPARPRDRVRSLRHSHTHRARRPGAAARRPRRDLRPALRARPADWAPAARRRGSHVRAHALAGARNGRRGKLPAGRAGSLRDRTRAGRRRDSPALGEAKMPAKGKSKRKGTDKDKLLKK